MSRLLWLAVLVGLALVPASSSARILENWPFERLFKESDLIIIATASKTDETADKFEDKRWPLEFVGQATTFKVIETVKGSNPGKEIAVLHFKFGKARANGSAEIIDGPLFIKFRTKALDMEHGGVLYSKRQMQYLLFLKKDKEGRYEPVSGRIDPALSVKESFDATVAD